LCRIFRIDAPLQFSFAFSLWMLLVPVLPLIAGAAVTPYQAKIVSTSLAPFYLPLELPDP
jgi:hypothetical protein